MGVRTHEPAQSFARQQRTKLAGRKGSAEQPRYEHQQQLEADKHKGQMGQNLFQLGIRNYELISVWFEIVDIEDAELEGTYDETGSIDALA